MAMSQNAILSKIPIIALPVPENSFFLCRVLKIPKNPLNIEIKLERVAEKMRMTITLAIDEGKDGIDKIMALIKTNNKKHPHAMTAPQIAMFA
ncbi:MAG: hypothetical protein ABSG97_02080 [Sedimentisphaerales bacterium]|jgi:hypothetical protein